MARQLWGIGYAEKHMDLLVWLEESPLAEWVRASTVGYPTMITLHSLGLAIMVGLSIVLSLRVLGWFGGIPYSSLRRLLKIAWIGFVVNLISGSALFTAEATAYIADLQFLLKMAFVTVGAFFVAVLQTMINTGSIVQASAAGPSPAVALPTAARAVASFVIVAWTGGMITGRLIAYL
jgi:hypothetical protein